MAGKDGAGERVFDEPHLSGGPMPMDPSEAKAAARLDRPVSSRDAAAHSVYDEPTLPGLGLKAGDVIDRDWLCSACGYNLRGTEVGEACPECGAMIQAVVPPAGEVSYGTWLDERRQATGHGVRWGVLLASMLVGGVLSVLGTFLVQGVYMNQSIMLAGVMAMVVIGPTIEELMKTVVATFLIETRPYLFRSGAAIFGVTFAAALGFAVIENLIYLKVYIPNPSPQIIAWRWSVCVLLHTGCTALTTVGLVKVWRAALRDKKPPQLAGGFSWLLAAIVVHGAYNGLAIVLELSGVFS